MHRSSAQNQKENKSSQKEQRPFEEWRKQTKEIIEKLQQENASKDQRIAELAKQAQEATDRYEQKKSQLSTTHGDLATKLLIEKLQIQIVQLENTIKEKDNLITSFKEQLAQTKDNKDSEVSVLKDSIENVIREKDTEIRRLKALWSPMDFHSEQLDGVGSLEEVSEATKILNASEFRSGKHKFRYGISAENLNPDKSTITTENSKPKTHGQIDFIHKALNQNVFLKGLNAVQVSQLIECMTLQVFESGSDVITEGEFGTHLYVLEKGKVEVYHSKGLEHAHIIDLQAGAVFGELAILYNCRRTASVKAKSKVHVWCLERQHFQSAVKRSGELQRQEYIRLLNTVEKLNSLSENKLMRIADCLEESIFHNGDYIIRQGDVGDTFYIIQNGKVKVTHSKGINRTTEDYEEEFVCYLESGQYFGEGALLTEEKRSANIIAESVSVTVLLLDRQAFNSFVGPIADIARTPSSGQNHVTDDKSQNHIAKSHFEFSDLHDQIGDDPLSHKTSIATRVSKETESVIKRTSLQNLKTLRILGQGGFGCVKLVFISSLPKHAFALKGIRKAKIITCGQEQHVLAEKNIMLAMKSPFVGKLHRTFKDDWKVYFLMDAYLGGDVYGVLKREGALMEQAARFCAACVLEAFDYLHSNEIVYRDLKPENLMIDHTGYVKLVDFGFAKHIRPGYKTWTFCGTPEYFPPEILANLGHDFSADIWSYGILIYELLSRTTPFIAGDDMSVYENILNGLEGVKFSRLIPKPAELLIRSLCKLEPRDRLGYQKGGFGDIRKQRWFQGFDWQGLRSHRIVSPLNIEVKSPTDTTNFDETIEDPIDYEKDREIMSAVVMTWDESF